MTGRRDTHTPTGRVLTAVRLPRDLHAQLTERARRLERSLNAEIIVLLRRAVEGDDER